MRKLFVPHYIHFSKDIFYVVTCVHQVVVVDKKISISASFRDTLCKFIRWLHNGYELRKHWGNILIGVLIGSVIPIKKLNLSISVLINWPQINCQNDMPFNSSVTCKSLTKYQALWREKNVTGWFHQASMVN